MKVACTMLVQMKSLNLKLDLIQIKLFLFDVTLGIDYDGELVHYAMFVKWWACSLQDILEKESVDGFYA